MQSSESGELAHRKSCGGKMGKIMDKVKHNYNVLPELRTKFFHKHNKIKLVQFNFPPVLTLDQ